MGVVRMGESRGMGFVVGLLPLVVGGVGSDGGERGGLSIVNSFVVCSISRCRREDM